MMRPASSGLKSPDSQMKAFLGYSGNPLPRLSSVLALIWTVLFFSTCGQSDQPPKLGAATHQPSKNGTQSHVETMIVEFARLLHQARQDAAK